MLWSIPTAHLPYRHPPHLCRASPGMMPGSGQNPGPPTQASSQLSAPLSPLTCLHSIFKCHWGKILQKEIPRSLQGTEAGEERCSFQMADRGQKLSMGQTKKYESQQFQTSERLKMLQYLELFLFKHHCAHCPLVPSFK